MNRKQIVRILVIASIAVAVILLGWTVTDLLTRHIAQNEPVMTNPSSETPIDSVQSNSLPLTIEDSSAIESESESVLDEIVPEEPEPIIRKVRFSAVGDNLIHGSIYLQGAARAAETDKDYDFTYLYEGFADFLTHYDVNFINQETLITDELAPSHYPCFATPGEIGREAYRLGWRVFGSSNNHSYDKGAAGISSTLRFWESMPDDVVNVGYYRDAEDYMNIRKHTVNDVTIAYLAYTQYTNGIPTPADAEAHIIYTSQADIMEQQIRQAKEEADVVVVSVHWGVEDSHTVTQGQKDLAVQFGNWGADVIIGTHPHVIQTIEMLTNEDGSSTLCAYSLGNFVSAQSRPDELIGVALSFDLLLDEEDVLTIENVQAHPVVTDYGSGYSDVRVLMLKDYTAEEAAAHGARGSYPEFGYEYIQQVIRDYIPEEYINWGESEA